MSNHFFTLFTTIETSHDDVFITTIINFNLGSLRKVSTHCLTNVTVPYIFNAYLRTTFRITLARDWHIYISTI